MATTKTLTPTNQAITLAAFTEKPDNRTNVTNDDRLADAVNTLNSKTTTVVSKNGATFNVYETIYSIVVLVDGSATATGEAIEIIDLSSKNIPAYNIVAPLHNFDMSALRGIIYAQQRKVYATITSAAYVTGMLYIPKM